MPADALEQEVGVDGDGLGSVDGELDLDLGVDRACRLDVGPDLGRDERDSFELGGIGDEAGARADLELAILERRVKMAGDGDLAPVGVVGLDGKFYRHPRRARAGLRPPGSSSACGRPVRGSARRPW